MRNEFCPELSTAIDRKMSADAALLRLREAVCDGTTPYSKSALLSAMEHCDDAMDGVWKTFRSANANGSDVGSAVEPVRAVADTRGRLAAAG